MLVNADRARYGRRSVSSGDDAAEVHAGVENDTRMQRGGRYGTAYCLCGPPASDCPHPVIARRPLAAKLNSPAAGRPVRVRRSNGHAAPVDVPSGWLRASLTRGREETWPPVLHDSLGRDGAKRGAGGGMQLG